MDYLNSYADFLKKFYSPRGKKIIFDCSNGTVGPIFKKLGVKFLVNDRPDGNFPAHGPDPMKPEALQDISEAVKENKADLGVIFDADGDRVFFMDDLRRGVDPDIVAVLIGKNFKGPVILDVRSGYLPRELLKNVKDCRVGHFFIKKMMAKIKAGFAAESSGHYYFPLGGGAYFDSGILAALHLINSLPPKLSEFIYGLHHYFKTGELNFKIKDKTGIMKSIEKRFQKEAAKTSKIDGIKMEFKSPDWWFSVRPSNTEDLLRLNLEAKDEEIFEEKTKELRKFLK